MPLLPLPLGGSGLSGGDLPVSDGADVLDEFSSIHKRPNAAPVRDDFCAAFAVSHIVYQDASVAALAQCDPLIATDIFLTGIAIEREVIPFPGESESSLRARLFTAPEIVTPDAIVSRVNAIVAPYTDVECELVELELDGLFIHDGTVTAWDSFIGANPRYPDRYYADDATENGDFFLENNDPGGALLSMGFPRSFHLRIPVLDASDEDFAFAIDSDDLIMPIGDGSDTSGAESDGTGATSVFGGGLTSDELYAAIVGTVESIKGQGISWSALADVTL